MRYVPLTRKTFEQLRKDTSLALAYKSAEPTDTRCQLLASRPAAKELTPICDLDLSIVNKTMVVEKFSVAPEKMQFSPAYKEAFLELTLKYLMERANKQKIGRIILITTDPLAPELLVNYGFSLSARSNKEYRGEKLLEHKH